MKLSNLIAGRKRAVAIAGVSAVMVAAIACSGGGDTAAEPTALNTAGVLPVSFTNGVPLESGRDVVAQTTAGMTFLPTAAQTTGIWVDGVGEIDVEPDIATLNIGVEARESTVSEAREAAASALQSVIDALKAEGVAEDDLETTSFNISPQQIWREVRDVNGTYSQPEIIGYIVSNQLRVTIRDLDNVGNVVDTAAEQAGDLVRINSIGFSVDNPSQYGEQLRRLAAADAAAKAQIYADAMGVQVGPLVFLSESGSSAPRVVVEEAALGFAAADSVRSATPFIAGDASLSARIQAVFSIVSPQ